MAKATVGRLSQLILGFLKWTDVSELMKILSTVQDYELEDDPLIIEFVRGSVPLEYYSFAALIFSAIKDDVLEFVNEYYADGGGDINIYGYSLGGGLGCALMCLIGFWKKMYGLGRLRARLSCLLVGQINLFNPSQSTVVNSLMIKHAGRFNMFSVSHRQDYATSLSSGLAESGGLRIELIDYSFPSDGRSVHSILQYIESMDRFYLRMSGISIGGTPSRFNDVTTLNHVRAFATLPSSVLARGSTQVKMAHLRAIRQPRFDSVIERAIQQGLAQQGHNVVYVRPTYLYFTDFTVNPSTASAVGEFVSGAASVFIRSTLAEFQNRLVQGSVARNAIGLTTVHDAIVVPVVERIYIGPSAIYSRLFLGTSTSSTWNGYRTYSDQYGETYINANELNVTVINTFVRPVEFPRQSKKRSSDGQASNASSRQMDTTGIDENAIVVPARKMPAAKRQKITE